MSNIFPDFSEEQALWQNGYNLVIGIDEVGRGCFAGPVVASACAFAPKFPPPTGGSEFPINDSKQLKPQERKRASEWIKKNCLAFGIGEVGVNVINKVGIGKATAQAMRRAAYSLLHMAYGNKNYTLNAVRYKPYILVDAFHIKYLRGIGLKHQRAIKKGDQKCISIAAASIVAKVFRDSLMLKLSKRYITYGFGRNKGYGTRFHQEAIKKNGTTKLHRTIFIETFLNGLRTKGDALRG